MLFLLLPTIFAMGDDEHDFYFGCVDADDTVTLRRLVDACDAAVTAGDNRRLRVYVANNRIANTIGLFTVLCDHPGITHLCFGMYQDDEFGDGLAEFLRTTRTLRTLTFLSVDLDTDNIRIFGALETNASITDLEIHFDVWARVNTVVALFQACANGRLVSFTFTVEAIGTTDDAPHIQCGSVEEARLADAFVHMVTANPDLADVHINVTEGTCIGVDGLDRACAVLKDRPTLQTFRVVETHNAYNVRSHEIVCNLAAQNSSVVKAHANRGQNIRDAEDGDDEQRRIARLWRMTKAHCGDNKAKNTRWEAKRVAQMQRLAHAPGRRTKSAAAGRR